MANRGEFTMAIGQAQGLGQNSDEEPPDEEIIVYIEKVTGFIPRRKQSDGEEEAFNLQNSSHLMFNFGGCASHDSCEFQPCFAIRPVAHALITSLEPPLTPRVRPARHDPWHTRMAANDLHPQIRHAPSVEESA